MIPIIVQFHICFTNSVVNQSYNLLPDPITYLFATLLKLLLTDLLASFFYVFKVKVGMAFLQKPLQLITLRIKSLDYYKPLAMGFGPLSHLIALLGPSKIFNRVWREESLFAATRVYLFRLHVSGVTFYQTVKLGPR